MVVLGKITELHAQGKNPTSVWAKCYFADNTIFQEAQTFLNIRLDGLDWRIDDGVKITIEKSPYAAIESPVYCRPMIPVGSVEHTTNEA